MTTNLLTSASSTRHHHTATRFADSDTQEIQERAATALFTKGMALANLGDYAAAIAAFDEVIARFGGGNVPEMLEWVVSWAWGAKGAAQEELGDHVLQHLDGSPNGNWTVSNRQMDDNRSLFPRLSRIPRGSSQACRIP